MGNYNLEFWHILQIVWKWFKHLNKVEIFIQELLLECLITLKKIFNKERYYSNGIRQRELLLFLCLNKSTQLKEEKLKPLTFRLHMVKLPKGLQKIGIVLWTKQSKLLKHGLKTGLKFRNGKNKNNKLLKNKNLQRPFLEDVEIWINFSWLSQKLGVSLGWG